MKLFPRLGFLVGLALTCRTGSAVVVNDGTATNNLARMINEQGRGEADPSLVVNGAELEASQAGAVDLTFFPVRSTWYAIDRAPTSGVYSVSADFRPAALTSERRGGVMGWLDDNTGKGISLQVWPAGSPSFQVKVIDFKAADGNANESLSGLFNLDGTPATEEFTSAGAELGTNYVATNLATFQFEFTAPTAADLTAVSNTTARITAKVFQGLDTGGAPIQVSRTIELLTDLPIPGPNSHRFGYFAYWANIFAPGETIGYLDNLSASGVRELVNVQPVVGISSPANGAVFAEGAAIEIRVDASDPDGTITSVEFLAGTSTLGTVTEAPFNLTWTNVAAGNYTLTARASDNRGGTTTSAAVNLTVTTSSGTGPTMTIARNGNFIEISWLTSGFQLQMKTNLSAAAWTDVPDTVNTNRVTMPVASGDMFFRLWQTGATTGPTLSIQASGNSVVVSWPLSVTGYRLQAKSNLGAGAWEDIPTTGNQLSESITGSVRFYRLINP